MSESSPSGLYGKVLVQPDKRLQVKYMHLQCSIGRRYSYVHTIVCTYECHVIETTLYSLSQQQSYTPSSAGCPSAHRPVTGDVRWQIRRWLRELVACDSGRVSHGTLGPWRRWNPSGRPSSEIRPSGRERWATVHLHAVWTHAWPPWMLPVERSLQLCSGSVRIGPVRHIFRPRGARVADGRCDGDWLAGRLLTTE